MNKYLVLHGTVQGEILCTELEDFNLRVAFFGHNGGIGITRIASSRMRNFRIVKADNPEEAAYKAGGLV